MASSSCDAALARLLVHEGGYTNHPSDPGGPTNFGITIADYRQYVKRDATAADVRAMNVEQAKAIYRAHYWDALRCDDLPAGIDYCVFDYAVNSGIVRAGKVLRRVVGEADTGWQVNDAVLAALAKRDGNAVIAAICDERLRFLRSLRTWPVFGAGWGARVAAVKTASLHMAANAHTSAPPGELSAPPAAATLQSRAKGRVTTPRAVRSIIAAGGSAAAGGEAALLHWIGAHPIDAGIAAFGVIALAGFFLAVVHRTHQTRQTAPTPNTPVVPAAATA
jgi:lysozyme family protein